MKKVIKWVKRIFIGLIVLLLFALIVGFIYEQISRANMEKQFKPKGKLVDVGGHKLHIVGKGTGSPTVVFESGLDAAGSLAWSAVHDSIARYTRAIAYDRAGVLWSERGEAPKTVEEMGKDLNNLLKNAGEKGPFILVGHSLAGITLRSYLDHHRDQVAGLVFVDASHPEQMERFPKKARELMQPPPTALIKLASHFGIVRLFMSDGKLPATKATDSCNVIMNARMPISIHGVMDELGQLETLNKEAQSFGQLDSLPLIVLTGTHPLRYKMLPDTVVGKEVTKIWMELQEDHLNLSTRSEHMLADKSFHYIQFEQPELVIAAIKKLINGERNEKEEGLPSNEMEEEGNQTGSD